MHGRRREQAGDLASLGAVQLPETLAERDLRADAPDPLFRQFAPTTAGGALQDQLNRQRPRGFGGRLIRLARQGVLIAGHHLFEHLGGGHAGQVGAARRGGQGQTKPDQVMGGIADHRLIEIADLDADLPVRAGYGA